jgi:hypothetical protein
VEEGCMGMSLLQVAAQDARRRSPVRRRRRRGTHRAVPVVGLSALIATLRR